MRIYLDVSCLNRPFDDQGQSRIRLESEAVTLILDRCERGEWQHVSSAIASIEIDAMPDTDRRTRVKKLLPSKLLMLELSEEIFERASKLESLGLKSADAVHVAATEATHADVLLTCDDRLCRLAKRRRAQLKVSIMNPVDWLKEHSNVDDA